MNKLSIVACSIIVLLSCTKSETVSETSSLDTSEVKTNQTFYAYNLKGDGLTDDTQVLQKLINDSSAIYLKAGTYIINQTLVFKANTRFTGENGTIIKAGQNMSGTLLEHGRFILAEKSDNSAIIGVKFMQSAQNYNLKDWANSCIFILDTKSFEVRNCDFDFHLKYQRLGMEAVWISGTRSNKNLIIDNKISSLGIRYAENGADSSRVESNIINDAYSNALSATGNHPSDIIKGCLVLNNKIAKAGRMGIEDWGNTTGTIIRGNSIVGSGTDPNQAIDGIALSAVGISTSVINNFISDGKIYGIEVRGNYGVQVKGNEINLSSGITGIILNYTFSSPRETLPVAIVNRNKISGSSIGVHLFGDYESNVSIDNNRFTNILSKAISIESGAKAYTIDLKNNYFKFSIPNLQDRFAVFTYTKYANGTVNQQLTMLADTITFSSSASLGKGVDFGVVIRTDNARIERLQVWGNNNRNADNIPVNAISALGAKPINTTFNSNVVTGALTDLNGFIKPKLNANNFVQ